jgi:predicted transcriptional regulator
MLGVVMKRRIRNEAPALLDVVALLKDLPAQDLARGQVGTVVEQLDDKNWLVEFSDDEGRAYAVAPCQEADLLVLHYIPELA